MACSQSGRMTLWTRDAFRWVSSSFVSDCVCRSPRCSARGGRCFRSTIAWGPEEKTRAGGLAGDELQSILPRRPACDAESVWRESLSSSTQSDPEQDEAAPKAEQERLASIDMSQSFISAQAGLISSTRPSKRTSHQSPLHWQSGLRQMHWMRRAIPPTAQAPAQTRMLHMPLHRDPNRMSPYEIMELPKSASAKDIKSRYYDLVKELHPDTARCNNGPDKTTMEEFHAVVRAYELLSDPKKRALYDKYRLGWGSPEFILQERMQAARTGPMRAYRPRTQEEWEAWNMWSDILRKTATAGKSPRSSWDDFYGFPEQPSEEEARRRTSEAMPQNRRIFVVIILVSWLVGAYQLQRISEQSAISQERANERTAAVAANLKQAREYARSSEGQQRQRAMLERVRQNKARQSELPASEVLEDSPVPALPAAAS